MRAVDLTHTIRENMPVYPGTDPPLLETANTWEKDGFKETRLTLFSHTGTHVDAPAHLFPGRTTLDQFPPEQFIGMALRIDCRHLQAGEAITESCLAPYGDKPLKADFLLFDTGWSAKWGKPAYFGDYPCLDDGMMARILKGNYKGIGFDVIGLDPVRDGGLPRHRRLFAEKDILNLENLVNLEKCGDELFHFSCFPLKFASSDGAPVRAVAWWE